MFIVLFLLFVFLFNTVIEFCQWLDDVMYMMAYFLKNLRRFFFFFVFLFCFRNRECVLLFLIKYRDANVSNNSLSLTDLYSGSRPLSPR